MLTQLLKAAQAMAPRAQPQPDTQDLTPGRALLLAISRVCQISSDQLNLGLALIRAHAGPGVGDVLADPERLFGMVKDIEREYRDILACASAGQLIDDDTNNATPDGVNPGQ
jgi:hypothetical protein